MENAEKNLNLSITISFCVNCEFDVLPAGLCDDHFCAKIMEFFPEFGHLKHTLRLGERFRWRYQVIF